MGGSATITGFLGIIGALCRAVAACGARGAFGPPEQGLTLAIHRRLTRLAARFTALATRLEADILPPPQNLAHPNPAPPNPAPPNPAPRNRVPRSHPGGPGLAPTLPRRRGFVAAGGYQIRGHAGQLAHMLNQPGISDLAAADPRIGRVLRPLCHLLGITLPDFLRLPPRPQTLQPRQPRRRKPNPARTARELWRLAWAAPEVAPEVTPTPGPIWLQRAPPPKPSG